jgi:hypothetical protein
MEVRGPKCSWATRRTKMESDEMKRKRVRTPAGPRGNQDQNRPGLARGIEMSQHAARPTRAALVKRLCSDGVRKSRYGRAKGAALTGGGGFMSWTLLVVARQHEAGLLTGALARQNTKEKLPSKDQPVSMPDVIVDRLSPHSVSRPAHPRHQPPLSLYRSS